MLYFVSYDGGTGVECAVIEADSFNEAEEWASVEAEELFYQSGIQEYNEEDYLTEEDWEDSFNDEMISNIFYSVVEFDEENPDHIECLDYQGGEPFEI